MSWTNSDALHRHACHAFEDFEELRQMVPHITSDEQRLWHSISHHLRHVVFRSSHEVREPRMKVVRRSNVSSRHR